MAGPPPQLEVLVRFGVGISINGRYCDTFRTIAWVYLSTLRGFWFDALTSIPLSWVDYEVYKVRPGLCQAGRLL
jgi:hypothetical protein